MIPCRFLDSQERHNLRTAHGAPLTTQTLHCGFGFGKLSITTLELELIQTQMTQKPMLRAEVYARALRASQNHHTTPRHTAIRSQNVS
jgi:hypothetical protein